MPFESTCVPSVASRFPLCIQYVITKFIYLPFVIHLVICEINLIGSVICQREMIHL